MSALEGRARLGPTAWLKTASVTAALTLAMTSQAWAQGTFNFAMTDEPPHLDVQVTTATLTTLVDMHILETLYTFNSNLEPVPLLEMLTALANRLRHTDELLRHSATRNVNVEEAAQLTLADRAADMIAEFGGSWKFIFAAVLFFNAWVLINTWLLADRAFDVYPYLLLSTGINMLAVMQAPIILMSQNRQSHKDRLRAEIDYQVNLKNELALNEIIQRLKTLERDYLRLASEKQPE